MKLAELHKEFIERSRRPLLYNDLPIVVKNQDKPVIAIEKWSTKDGKLSKKFMFESYDDRNEFIKSILEYESEVGHHCEMKISENDVTISLLTKDVNKVTELDKEFAKYADTVRKDLVYNFSRNE